MSHRIGRCNGVANPVDADNHADALPQRQIQSQSNGVVAGGM